MLPLTSVWNELGEQESNLREPDSKSGWDADNPSPIAWRCSESNRGHQENLLEVLLLGEIHFTPLYTYRESNPELWD